HHHGLRPRRLHLLHLPEAGRHEQHHDRRRHRAPVQGLHQPEPRRGHEPHTHGAGLHQHLAHEPLHRRRRRGGGDDMKRLGRIWTVIVYLFLYAPMFILFIGSFNDGKDLSEFEGFTLGNYADLFSNSHLVGLLGNSVLLALCSAVLATLLGTLAALGIKAMRGRLRRLVMSLTNIPLVNPEIVTGVSLALLFVFIGRRMLSTENVFGFATLLIAHVTF